MNWEVAIRATNSLNQALELLVTVYLYNPATKDFELYDSGYTKDVFSGYGDDIHNGAFDIGDSDTNEPTINPLPAGTSIFFIKIGNKYCRVVHSGFLGYGDIRITYNTSTQSLTYSVDANCGYEVSGPYNWTNYTITLKNDFGKDKSSCYGSVQFNSATLTDVGISGTQLTRESGTFPHTISGIDNQVVNSYMRKWRNWFEDGITNISKTQTDLETVTHTAKYAKQTNVNMNNDFGGGIINVNSVPYSCPTQNLHFYDDGNYEVFAINQIYNGLQNDFSYWLKNGQNIGSQNPLTFSEPEQGFSLTANYTKRPSNAYENVYFGSVIGNPVVIYWTDNVNVNVNQYHIYRKILQNGVWGPETHLATVGRGVQTFTDNEIILAQWKQYDRVDYDVRQYYSVNSTFADPLWYTVYGWGYRLNSEGMEQIAQIANEIPNDYAISNYPNPFNPSTTISYQIPSAGFVTLKVYDILGKEVADLINENKSAGYYNVSFNAGNLPSGIYIYTIQTNGFVQSKKMLFLK